MPVDIRKPSSMNLMQDLMPLIQLIAMLTLTRKTRWQLLPLYTNFQTDITWKFCKHFEVCKSLGYPLGI